MFEQDFLLQAWCASVLLALISAPLSVLLSWKRLSLSADTFSHALLPGAAIGYFLMGLSTLAMTLGGLCTGLILAFFVSRKSSYNRSDSKLAGLSLAAISLGVLLISIYGSSVDLLHFLFGHILAISTEQFTMIALISIIGVILLLSLFRIFLLQTIDPQWAEFQKFSVQNIEFLFLSLVIFVLVASLQIFGTLLSVGFLVLPGLLARNLFQKLISQILGSVVVTILATTAGLCISSFWDLPSGPLIIFILSCAYFLTELLPGRQEAFIGPR